MRDWSQTTARRLYRCLTTIPRKSLQNMGLVYTRYGEVRGGHNTSETDLNNPTSGVAMESSSSRGVMNLPWSCCDSLEKLRLEGTIAVCSLESHTCCTMNAVLHVLYPFQEEVQSEEGHTRCQNTFILFVF